MTAAIAPHPTELSLAAQGDSCLGDTTAAQTRVLSANDVGYCASFNLPPFDAVIAAFAQARRDFSTWAYRERYATQVQRGKYGYVCGPYWAKA